MLWFFVALISAIGQSGIEILGKKTLEKTEQLNISFSIVFFALPFTTPILFFGYLPSEIPLIIWFVLAGSTISTVLVLLFLIKSIKFSPLSKSIPMFAFTPVFLLITSPLILQEIPSTLGIIGTILIVMGVYFLHFSNNENLLFPFKQIWREKGPVFALLASFIVGIGANFDKIGIENSNPIFWVVLVNISSSLVLGSIILITNKDRLKQISFPLKPLIIIGGLTALTQISLMYAFTLTIVPYAIAIKRSHILFSSLMGFAFFKERFAIRKLASIIIMIVGMILILLAN